MDVAQSLLPYAVSDQLAVDECHLPAATHKADVSGLRPRCGRERLVVILVTARDDDDGAVAVRRMRIDTLLDVSRKNRVRLRESIAIREVRAVVYDGEPVAQ